MSFVLINFGITNNTFFQFIVSKLKHLRHYSHQSNIDDISIFEKSVFIDFNIYTFIKINIDDWNNILDKFTLEFDIMVIIFVFI